MKRSTLWIIALATLSAITGCIPEKRVVWSPDGRWAAVIGGDGLYLCDDRGQLSPRVAENVRQVAWMPDSRALVMVRSEVAETWPEMSSCLTEPQRARLIPLAERLREQVLTYEGDLDDFESPEFDELSGGEQGAVLLYLRSEHADELGAKLGDKWEELEEAEVNVWLLHTAELTGDGARLAQIIFRSPDEMRLPRLSPDGAVAAFLAPLHIGSRQETRLHVVPADASQPPRVVADFVSAFSDWSADGRYLVFAHTQQASAGDALRLGSIARRLVRDETGRLLDEFPDVEDLAGVVFQDETRVRCLKDGRILFSAMEISLPCAARDMPQNASLFALQPEMSPLVMRLIPRQSEPQTPDMLFFFEVSPDEQRVSIPGSDGELSILTLATGDVWTLIDDDQAPGKCLLVPTWRSSDELCYTIGPEEGSQRAAVALFKLDWSEQTETRRVISADWPEAVVKGFLVPEEEED